MRKERFAGLGIAVLATMPLSPRLSAREENKRRGVTVADTIRMTTVPEPQFAAQDASKNRVPVFSPDKKHFVIVVERGILETNEREFSLLLYQSEEIFRSPEPKVLVTLRSHSNRDAVRNVRWMDSDRIVFLGEARSTSQVYSLRITDRRMEQLTDHATPVIDFDFDPKSQIIAYAAERNRLTSEAAHERCARGYAITNEALDDIPRSLEDCKQPSLLLGAEVYVKKPRRQPFPIVFGDYFEAFKHISMSPNGKYVLFDVLLRHVPAGWKEYQDPLIHAEAVASRNRGPFSWLSQFLVADTGTGEVRPIVDGTIDLTLGAAAWSPDGSSVVVSGAFLPLDVSDPAEQEARKAHSFIVEVNLSTRAFSKISDKQLIAERWDAETQELSLRPPVGAADGSFAIYRKIGQAWREETAALAGTPDALPEVTVEQDLNSAPRIFVRDAEHREKQLLLDLNPQFRELQFSKVERVTWRAKDGHEVEGGLYYPLHYKRGTRYPVVLQTHGFSEHEFWINGPWNSAFAAQPLAARDILVLQVGYATEKGSDAKVWRTPEEAPRQMSAYEGAIDYLDGRALIDRNRVGIIGFSRTVYSVEYTLTHSSYHFAAATVADGFDGGYLQYLVNPYSKRDWMTVNGGEPFGTTLDLWRERSPSFTVDRLRTPVRLEGYGGISAVIGNWEWYAKLAMLDRPADLVYIPDGTHLLVKPWERMTSQEGNVDWFSFWLKGEIDSVPEKREQYVRWNEMLQKK